ncbi:MAG TPA: substrate-binding domain-containing protein [Longimicrobiales bacterium]
MLLCSLFLLACAEQRERVVLATTTSVEDSGLLDTLAAAFQQEHPQYQLAPVAAGTGMVLEMGRRKDADVLITHDSAGEVQFVHDGHGYARRYVMQNDFIIIGPAADPAKIRGTGALAALRAIARDQATFVSRADDSGTHRREIRLWQEAGVRPTGEWYLRAGVGMGDALLLAGQKRAYILTDRATYVKFRPRIELDVMVDGDPPLLNKYSVIIVSSANNETGGKAFADWVVGESARALIARFGISEFGQPLFFVRQP